MGHLLLTVNLLMWAPVAVADMCAHLPGYTAHGKSCFKYYTIDKTWAAAEASCVADGGHLASIHSSEENAFVAGLVAGPRAIWIGLRGVPPNMAWLDNTNVDYAKWKANEPSEHGTACVRILPRFYHQWADSRCLGVYHYLCRVDDIVDQKRVLFTKIPEGVPVDAAAVPSSRHMVASSFSCARRCQQDAQCMHFIMSKDSVNYFCETYSSLKRPPTDDPPNDNYQKIVSGTP